MSRQEERAGEIIAHEAAKFISREAGPDSLITVTRVLPAVRGERVTVFVTVFPEEKTRPALAFLERQREAFSDHLKEHARLRPLPRIEFALDDGEKNRQRLDDLSNQS